MPGLRDNHRMAGTVVAWLAATFLLLISAMAKLFERVLGGSIASQYRMMPRRYKARVNPLGFARLQRVIIFGFGLLLFVIALVSTAALIVRPR